MRCRSGIGSFEASDEDLTTDMHRTRPCPEQAPRELLPVLGRQVQLSDLIGQFTSLAHELGLQVVPILARAVIAGKRTDDVDDREVPLLLPAYRQVGSAPHTVGTCLSSKTWLALLTGNSSGLLAQGNGDTASRTHGVGCRSPLQHPKVLVLRDEGDVPVVKMHHPLAYL